MDNEVYIVGCGPAAMMVAHACRQSNLPFRLFAPKAKPSFISGAQYLHRRIPGLVNEWEAFRLFYDHLGEEAGYQRKIYGGRLPNGVTTSWGKFPSAVRAWPLQASYKRAWQLYADNITEQTVNLEMVVNWSTRHIVFNTAPLRALMPLADYITEEVWIIPGMYLGSTYNGITYNGVEEIAWYRTSNIQGVRSTEYPVQGVTDGFISQYQEAIKVLKPVSTSAEIPGVWCAGRYGQWRKGVLVDDAYFQAREVLDSRYGPVSGNQQV